MASTPMPKAGVHLELGGCNYLILNRTGSVLRSRFVGRCQHSNVSSRTGPPGNLPLPARIRDHPIDLVYGFPGCSGGSGYVIPAAAPDLSSQRVPVQKRHP